MNSIVIPLQNYLNVENKIRLGATSKAMRETFRNDREVFVFQEYQKMKRAFFLRAFIQSLFMDRETWNELTAHMTALYQRASSPQQQADMLNRYYQGVPMVDERIMGSSLTTKLVKIDKILSHFIADSVKKIVNSKTNFKRMLQEDHHFKSNPNLIYKILKTVHDRSGPRGVSQQHRSGQNTLNAVERMTGGVPISEYIMTRTWKVSPYAPFAQLFDLGKKQTIVTLLLQPVSKRAVHAFLSQTEVKNGRVRNFSENPVVTTITNRTAARRNNGNKQTDPFKRSNADAFIAQKYPTFRKAFNTVPRASLTPHFKRKQAERRREKESILRKGKMPKNQGQFSGLTPMEKRFPKWIGYEMKN
jgi:hypothetical protein